MKNIDIIFVFLAIAGWSIVFSILCMALLSNGFLLLKFTTYNEIIIEFFLVSIVFSFTIVYSIGKVRRFYGK